MFFRARVREIWARLRFAVRQRRLCFVCSQLTSSVAPPAADKRSLVDANRPASQTPRLEDNRGHKSGVILSLVRARLRLYRLLKKQDPLATVLTVAIAPNGDNN